MAVEGDVRETTNTCTMFEADLANMFGNKHMKKCQYVALTFSEWHSGHAKKARLESGNLPDSMVKPYCKVTSLPFLQDKSGNWRYAFVGQGARAIAFRAPLARQLLDEKVSSFWDMHLLNFMCNKRARHGRPVWMSRLWPASSTRPCGNTFRTLAIASEGSEGWR